MPLIYFMQEDTIEMKHLSVAKLDNEKSYKQIKIACDNKKPVERH